MIYWFSVDPEQPDVLDVGIRNGLWGVEDGAREEIEELGPGDFILFFHRDEGFVLCEVESEPYTETVPVWSDVDYPHRVRISEPVATDRYAHLAEVHECLRDPETGEPFAGVEKAIQTLERTAGTFRPLSDEEVRCLLRRLDWPRPPGLAPPPDEEPAEHEEEESEAPAVAEPADDGRGTVDGSGDESEPAADAGTDEPAEARPAAETERDDAETEEAGPAAETERADAETERADAETEGEAATDDAEPDDAEPDEAEADAEADDGEPADDAELAEADEAEPDTRETGEADAAGREGPRVVLAPAAGNDASRGRWEATVEEGVPLERLADHLPGEELGRLREGAAAGRVRVWGTAPSRDERSRSQWEDSGPGDVILFTGGGEIFASARVLATRRDETLAEELWGRREDGDTWEFLFFTTAPAPHVVPYEEFNEVAGYEPGYRIPRLNILGADRSLRILGTFREFGIPASDESGTEAERQTETATEGPDGDAGPDGPISPETGDDGEPERPSAEEGDGGEAVPIAAGGVGPMDEERLRRLLFGRRELGRCALCGRLVPVELLEVVYVKPLDACTPEELEDVGNNVLPGCRLGCAGLFRAGFVVVEDGLVEPGRPEPRTEPVEERVEELSGQRCEYWHSGSEAYFCWHADEHGGGDEA